MSNKDNQNRDRLGRRSRFNKQPVGKKVRLTARDIQILQWLYRYRYLQTSHLLQIFEPQSPKRFVERLGDLYHETGLINRPRQGLLRFDALASSMFYEITAKGIELLAIHNAMSHRAVTFSRRAPRSYSPQTLHTMAIIEALLAIELETRKITDQRFVPVDEILAKAPESTRNSPNPLRIPVTLKPSAKYPFIKSRMETRLIPDALYGIEYLIDGVKRYRFWALECERMSPVSRSHTKATSTKLKHAAYDALVTSQGFKTHWGILSLKLSIIEAI